jgi:hypothetical protein
LCVPDAHFDHFGQVSGLIQMPFIVRNAWWLLAMVGLPYVTGWEHACNSFVISGANVMISL